MFMIVVVNFYDGEIKQMLQERRKNKKPPNLASGDFQPKPYHN